MVATETVVFGIDIFASSTCTFDIVIFGPHEEGKVQSIRLKHRAL